MGRGKLKMEMIGDEKTRFRTFRNRSKGLKKKLHELSTLCDVDACMIVYHSDGPCSSRPDFWPDNRDYVERIISRYSHERKEVGRKRNLDLSDVLGSRTKEEGEVDRPEKLKEKNGKLEGGAGIELEGLSYENLMKLLEKLDKKIADVDSLIDLKKREEAAPPPPAKDCSRMPPPPPAKNCYRMPPPPPPALDIVHVPMANPVFQGSEQVFYDFDFPDLSSTGFLESGFKNWMMMMMNTGKQENQEFYVSRN